MKNAFLIFVLPLVLVAGLGTTSLQALTPAEEITTNVQALLDETLGPLAPIDVQFVVDEYDIVDEQIMALSASFTIGDDFIGGISFYDRHHGSPGALPSVAGYDDCHVHVWFEMGGLDGDTLASWSEIDRDMLEFMMTSQLMAIAAQDNNEIDLDFEVWEDDGEGHLTEAVITMEVSSEDDLGQRRSGMVIFEITFEGSKASFACGCKALEGQDLPLEEEELAMQAVMVELLEGVRTNDPEVMQVVSMYLNYMILSVLSNQGD